MQFTHRAGLLQGGLTALGKSSPYSQTPEPLALQAAMRGLEQWQPLLGDL